MENIKEDLQKRGSNIRQAMETGSSGGRSSVQPNRRQSTGVRRTSQKKKRRLNTGCYVFQTHLKHVSI